MKNLWIRWKKFAQIVGNFQARIILSAFYFIFIAPIALGVKLCSDPLRLKKRMGSQWLEKASEPESLERMRRQF